MSVEVTIRDRQRAWAVSAPQLRKLTEVLLGECLGILEGELSVVLLSPKEMARVNETFLQHAGSTDVITFNYAAAEANAGKPFVLGEILICVAEAIAQGRRFRTTWQAELARYVVHGVLHLQDYDDGRAAARRRMKRAEDRLVRVLGRRFPFRNLARRTRRG